MPVEILQLQERAASADVAPRQEAIRQRVTAILPLYRLSRYRPIARPGQVPMQPATDETQPAARHVHHRPCGATPRSGRRCSDGARRR